MAIRINIHHPSPSTPATSREFASLVGRLVNRWIAGVIARCEREAALATPRRLDDRQLKDIGINRCQIGDVVTEVARERSRLQRCRQSC